MKKEKNEKTISSIVMIDSFFILMLPIMLMTSDGQNFSVLSKTQKFSRTSDPNSKRQARSKVQTVAYRTVVVLDRRRHHNTAPEIIK